MLEKDRIIQYPFVPVVRPFSPPLLYQATSSCVESYVVD